MAIQLPPALTEVVKIYVPSTSNVNQANPEAAAKFTDKVLTALAGMFGGATAQPAVGAWVSPVHGLVKENINIVYAYATPADMEANRAAVIALASNLASEMSQEAVSLELNGALYFIQAEAEAAAA